MLSVYFMIFILAAVLLAFFGVCALLFGKDSAERLAPVSTSDAKSVSISRRKGKFVSEKSFSGKSLSLPHHGWSGKLRALFSDVPEEVSRETSGRAASLAGVSPADDESAPGEPVSSESTEKTVVFQKEELTAALQEIPKPEVAAAVDVSKKEPAPTVVENVTDVDQIEEYYIRHFLGQYAAVSKTVVEDTRTVTHALIARSARLTGRKAAEVLQHLMVQESLQNAQRAYAMLPSESMLRILAEAFEDVVIGSKSETKTILAYDALKVMPQMNLASLRALSLLLLFYYSKNAENTSPAAFRRYAETYVKPLVADLPSEYSGYQQLEYLHCISLDNKDMPFGEVLMEFYPLVFAYRGCLAQEIKAITPDWPQDAFVPSVYPTYIKPDVVDDDMLPRFFERCGIADEKRRELLSALFHSRPVTYDRKEMEHVLEKIDPALETLQEAWDESMLRRSSLTLLGMYLAQLYLRTEMNEDFDLSHWI